MDFFSSIKVGLELLILATCSLVAHSQPYTAMHFSKLQNNRLLDGLIVVFGLKNNQNAYNNLNRKGLS